MNEITRVNEVSSQFKQALSEGSYKPGGRLPSERTLAERFKVGRNTIRESQQRLTNMGVLSKRVGSGTVVADSGEGILKEPFEYMLVLDQISVEDLFEARELIEVHLAGLAALRRTPEDLAKIKQALMEHASWEPHGPESITAERNALNRAFHRAVAEASHNVVLSRYLAVVLEARSEILALIWPDQSTWRTTKEVHERIYEAIVNGDQAGARRAMTMDMVIASEFWDQIREVTGANAPADVVQA